MITVHRYQEPEEFNRLWNLRNAGKAVVYYWAGSIYIFKMLAIMIMITVSSVSIGYCAELSRSNVIKAILGESESESLQGKIAIGETIRNRNSIKGVCAVRNVVVINGEYFKRVSLKSKYYKRTGKRLRPIPKEELEQSIKAYEISKTSNIVPNAIGWGSREDLEIFKTQAWFKRCYITKQIGNHYFYAVKQ